MSEQAKRIGRPPLPAEMKSEKRPYSVRLSPEHIEELKRRGTPALEAWLSRRSRGGPRID
jgi:hypothetical protein